MNGKDFKAFAQLVPDSAIIELNHYGWNALEPNKIRACIVPVASTEPAEQPEVPNA